MTTKPTPTAKKFPSPGRIPQQREPLWRPADADASAPSADALYDALRTALLDEYRARATYQRVIDELGSVRPFSNIVHAETRHARALEALFAEHNLEPPPDPWKEGSTDLPAFSSIDDACAAAIAGERQNVEMYDQLLQGELPVEVKRVFRRLRAGSLSHHLPAFERCVSRGRGRGSQTPRRSRRG